MASSSSWLNIYLFYSLFGVCARNCPAACRSSWGRNSCSCYTVSYAVQEPISCPGPCAYFSGRRQTRFTPLIVGFLLCTVRGNIPCRTSRKTVQIHKDFVRMRKSACGFCFLLARACSKEHRAWFRCSCFMETPPYIIFYPRGRFNQ